MRSAYAPSRSLTVFAVVLSLWQVTLPLATIQAQESSTAKVNQTKDTLGTSRPASFEAPNEEQDAALAAKAPIGEDPAEALNRENRSVALMMTGIQRLKIDEFDKTQLDALAVLAEQFALNPELAKLYSQDKLPPDLAAKVNAQALANIDPRILRSLIHLATPTELQGAGHEFLEISSITKGHRTDAGKEEREGLAPEGESLHTSPHSTGKAADVQAIDYLRGTEFTVSADSDGKPTVKTKHLPLKPVTVAWQDPAAANFTAGTRQGGIPYLNGTTPLHSSEQALQAGVLAGLQQGLEAGGVDVDLRGLVGRVGSFSNLGQLAHELGAAYLPTALESTRPLFLGPSGLRQTGQQALSDAVQGQIPAFGFFGDTPDELTVNAGRELITRNLGLAEGALIGTSSREVITNAGERFYESRLGDLPLGTLDGIRPGDRGDLERHVGRGLLAKLIRAEVGSIPLGASPAAIQRSLGLAWADLQANRQLWANLLGVPTTDAVGLLERDPDELFRQVGRVVLREKIEVLSNRDDALNLSARPAILDLPGGTDQERASVFLDAYAFKNEPRERLERIRAGSETFRNQIAGSDDELRAWLLVNAYAPGSDPNQPSLADRFLAADTSTFYDSGVEVITKGLTLDNAARPAVRTYLRTGELADDPPVGEAGSPVDLDRIAQTIGFPTRADFDAVFRFDAPLVGFAHVGRLALARVLATSPEAATPLLAKPLMPTAAELGPRLETIQRALTALRGDRSIRGDVDKALAAVDGLIATAQSGKVPNDLNLSADWRSGLGTIARAAQAAATSDRTSTERARALVVATNGLLAPDGATFFTTSTVNLGLPGGPATNKLIASAFQGDVPITDVVGQIGGAAFDETLDLPAKNTTYDFAKSVERELARGNLAAAQKVIDRFSAVNPALTEATALLQTSMRQLGRPLQPQPGGLPLTIMTGLGLTDIGARLIDAGLGTARSGSIEQILHQTPGTSATKDAVLASVGEHALYSVVAGTDLGVSGTGTTYTDLVYTTVSAQTGFLTGPEGPQIPSDPKDRIEQIIGQPLTRELARKLGIKDTSVSGLAAFIQTWRPDLDKNLAPRLAAIVAASVPGLRGNLPPEVLPALFDRSMKPEERTKRLEFILKAHVNARLVDPFIAERLNIEGVPSGAVIAAKNILLSDASPGEKSAALKSLGLATADAVAASRFGFPVTWLLDQTLDPKEKARIGLTIASRQLGLDPAVTALVDSAYQTFFIDGGIDTGTPGGRAQLAGLVTAAAGAAKVPTEYAALAAGFITGDVGATVVAVAGGRLNAELAKAGISGISFTDFYEAVVGPRSGSVAQAKDRAAAGSSGNGAILHELLHSELGRYQQAKQEQLMFAGLGLALYKSTGIPGLGEIPRAFLRGTVTDQAAAAGTLISAITRDPTAALVLGNKQLVEDFRKFAETGNPGDISKGSFAAMDGILGQYAPVPPGTSEAVIGFGATGDVAQLEKVINPDTLVFFGGAYLDEALGAPAGATAALYSAYQQVQMAQKAVDAARFNPFASPQDLGMAQTQLAQAQAGLLSLGVNLLAGEQFAKLDRSLGLPSGTLSTLVSTGIYAAMVPGIAIGQLLMTTVLPWAAPLLLASIFGIDLGRLLGGLFGGGTKEQTQTIILWSSLAGTFPENVEYNCIRKGLPTPPDDDKRPKGKEVVLGDFKCEVGKQIVFVKELPPGVFYGAPPTNFAGVEQAGQQKAAENNTERLIGNLLTISSRVDDESLIPNQIRSHSPHPGVTLQSLMDAVWGEGQVGSYAEAIKDDSQRRGYLYDEPGKQSFFADHLHWNY